MTTGAENGGPLTPFEWKHASRSPSYALIRQRFGSWDDAWRSAGYTGQGLVGTGRRSVRRQAFDRRCKQLLVRALTEAGGRPLSQREWNEQKYGVSARAISRHFPSWSDAWRSVGVQQTPFKRATKEDMVRALRQAGGSRGPISTTEWTSMGYRPGVNSIIRQFGSWKAAWMEAIGISPTRGRGRRSPSLDLLQALAGDSPAHLTTREQHILLAVRRGETITSIAMQLGISRSRVSQLSRDIVLKCQADGRSELQPSVDSPPRPILPVR